MKNSATGMAALGLAMAVGGAGFMMGGCETAPRTEGDRLSLSADVDATLVRFEQADPSLRPLLNAAVGYAVFPDVGKAGFIVGGGYGKGEFFEGGVRTGYCDISQGSIGFQVGAQSYAEVVLFLKKSEVAAFKSGNYEFAANWSAVALAAGAASKADYAKGVIVLVEPRGGLMAEASVGGQKFSYRAR